MHRARAHLFYEALNYSMFITTIFHGCNARTPLTPTHLAGFLNRLKPLALGVKREEEKFMCGIVERRHFAGKSLSIIIDKLVASRRRIHVIT